jgi:hypothetical protein
MLVERLVVPKCNGRHPLPSGSVMIAVYVMPLENSLELPIEKFFRMSHYL